MFGKIFASMFDGSMYGHWQAIVALQQMIVLADEEGVVDMTPEALSARTSIPLEIITTGIAELEQPDPKSRTFGENGRRIVRLDPARDWGWQIVNYSHYRAIRSAEERREYMRQYQRLRRSKEASTLSTTRKQVLAKSTNSSKQKQEVGTTSSDASQTRSTSGPYPDAFERTWAVYPKRSGGNPKKSAFKAWRARLNNGATAEEIHAGVERYARFCEVTGKANTEFVKHAATFLGPDEHFRELWSAPASPSDDGRDLPPSLQPGNDPIPLGPDEEMV